MYRPSVALAIRILPAAAILAAGAAHAEIYRCVDAGGDTTYQDAPCGAGHSMAANITELVQSCTTQECQAQLVRAREQAEERLRADRAALSEMQERRLHSEEIDLQRRQQSQQFERMRTYEAQLAAQQGADGGVYYPAYPLYPGAGYPGYGYPDYGRPGHGRPGQDGGGYWLPGVPCVGAACPTPSPYRQAPYAHKRREPVTSFTAAGQRPRPMPR
jgi:hypothetical protein